MRLAARASRAEGAGLLAVAGFRDKAWQSQSVPPLSQPRLSHNHWKRFERVTRHLWEMRQSF